MADDAEEIKTPDVSGDQILENVFHLVITATMQLANETNGERIMGLAAAKEYVADYLDKITAGLRYDEEQ